MVWRHTIGLLSCTLAIAGCSSFNSGDGKGDDAPADSIEAAPVESVSEPAERSSPFCTSMFDLYDQIAESSSDDDTPAIIAAYEAMDAAGSVPVEAAVDFQAVLAHLHAGGTDAATGTTVATTTAPATATSGPTTTEVFEEGYTPDDTPELRFNSFVQFTCGGGQNNPGPPATGPLAAEDTTSP